MLWYDSAVTDYTSTRLLLSLPDLKSYLGISDVDADRDANLIFLGNAILDEMEDYANRLILEESVTEYHDGQGNDAFLLANHPVASVEVWLDPEQNFGDDSKLSSDQYHVNAEAGRVEFFYGWNPIGRDIIKAEYTAGWPQSSVPRDLKHAFALIVSQTWKRKADRLEGMTAKSTADGTSITLTAEPWPAEAVAILDRYRRYD